MDFLVFQIYGPMASWGEAAVGEFRPTSDHPGRSALLGLVGACLGVRKDDEASQQALSGSFRFAVKQLSPGVLIRDYHTTQVPGRDRKAVYFTRKDEMSVPKDRLRTILSSREYRCDGLWQVAVRVTDQADWTLTELEEALRTPVFMPYLGRKACPLAAPLAPRQVQAKGLKEALGTELPPIHEQQVTRLGMSDTVDYFWEGEADDLVPQSTRFPNDEVVSRKRWQFRGRAEHHARIKETS